MSTKRTGLHVGETLSPWIDTVEMPTFYQLNQNIEVEVCVVGGGLAGLTTAYLLAKEGKKVCVLEDFEIGSGQTGRTTAHITNVLDERFYKLEKMHTKNTVKLAIKSHTAAMQMIEEIVANESIDCDLEKVDAYLYTEIGQPTEEIDKELSAAQELGFTDVQKVGFAPFKSHITGSALCFKNQLQFHPLKYMRGLVESIERLGGKLYSKTHVLDVSGGGDGAEVKTKNGYKVKCESVVVATNSPVNDRVAIHTKQASYRSYVIALDAPKGSVEKALYWDTQDPYHYTRVYSKDAESELIIIGGEDHKTGQNDHPQKCFSELEKWAFDRFPSATRVAYRWSGQVMEPVDGFAYIGHNPLDYQNVYVITGHSGNGMTYCTLAGILITDQIMKRKNEWESIYQPSRVNLLASNHYMKENANTLLQYGDWLMEKQISDIQEIERGEGVVFRKGLQMVAAYKNENDIIEMNSAVCTHLGGIVRWNSVEKSWDCPCHGSRFDCHGKVLEGPACRNLKPIESLDTDEFEALKVSVPISRPNLDSSLNT